MHRVRFCELGSLTSNLLAVLLASIATVSSANDKTWKVAYDGEQSYEFTASSPVFSRFSPSGNLLAIACRDATIRLWDLQSGRELRRLVGHSRTPTSISFSPDEKRIVSCSIGDYPKGPFRVWSVATGECLYEQVCPPNTPFCKAITYAPSGRYIVAETTQHAPIGSNAGGSIDTFDAETFRKIKMLADCRMESRSLMFSTAGDKLLIGDSGANYGAALLDIRTNAIRRFPRHFGHEVISPDGRYVASNNHGEELVIFDTSTFTEIRRLRVPNKSEGFDFGDGMSNAVFSPDSQSIFAISKWFWLQLSIETGKVLQYGRIERSPKNTITISYNGLRLAETAQGIGVVLWDLSNNTRLTRLSCFPEDGRWAVETATGYYDHSDDLVPRFNSLPDKVSGQEYQQQYHDREVVKRMLAERPVTSKPNGMQPAVSPLASGRLFVLAVGVSEYDDPTLNLSFCHADAEAITAKFAKQKGVCFADVQAQVYTNKQATVTNIKEGLAWLQRSCTDKDVAVVLFSGHGLRAERGLYYVTHEANLNGIQYTCLNWETVAESLEQTKANQVLFLSDVCHAGAFGKSDLLPQQELAEKLRRSKGVMVFTSSQGDESSFERPEWGHGAFCRSILDALDGKADTNKSGDITVAELTKSVTDQVVEITNGQQHPMLAEVDSSDPNLVIARSVD